jgi:hypothetical protein
MRRLHVVFFLWSAVAVGIAHAVPARPLYEPAPPPPPFNLRGTTWDGSPKQEDQMIVFEEDGKLSYGGIRRDGIWRLEGHNTVYFELNNAYRMFRGTVQGNVIVGESWNIAGLRWPTRLVRVAGPK